MLPARIVMRPVYDGRLAAVVHHFAADFDTIADAHGTARRYVDVVDDLNRAGRRSGVECFVRAARPDAEEETRRRRDRRLKIDLRGSGRTVCCRQVVHTKRNHALQRRRQEPGRRCAKWDGVE